jgi:PAS domain S-box-containing protein
MAEGQATMEERRIKEVLREQPLGMNIKEISRAVGMSRNSVAKYLDVLTATGHLDVRQIGNAKLYYLSHRIPLQNILQISHEMIVMLDRDLRVVKASDSFITFIGTPRDGVLGNRLSRLRVPILSNQEDMDLAVLVNGGPSWTKEIRLVKDGNPFFLNARFVPTVFDGGNPGITVMFENITGQRVAEIALMENERFLFNVLQVSPTPKYVIDRNHKIVFWNRSLEIMTKLHAEDMVGTHFQWKAFYPAERPCLSDLLLDGNTALLEQLYGGRCSAPDPETSCECTDFFPTLGTIGKWLHCTATLIRDSQGNITGAMEIFEDVTEQKQREFRIEPGS